MAAPRRDIQRGPVAGAVDWRRAGLRRTPQRETILRIVRAGKEHGTAERIHQEARRAIPDISLATVYRTLRILKERGLIHEFSGGTGPSRYDGTEFDHEHVRCIGCGIVVDVDLPEIGHVREQVAARTGFVIGSTPLLFQGLCGQCAKSHRTAARPARAKDPDAQPASDLDRDWAEGPW